MTTIEQFKQFELEQGIGAKELTEMCPFQGILVKIYQDKAKLGDRMDWIFEIAIPAKENRIGTIRYTPFQIKCVIEFLTTNQIADLKNLLGSKLLFEKREFGFGHPRPAPTKIIKE